MGLLLPFTQGISPPTGCQPLSELWLTAAKKRCLVTLRLVARSRSVYSCTKCGGQQPKWMGRCPGCGAWETLVEQVAADAGRRDAIPEDGRNTVVQLGEIDASNGTRILTGIPELDRVLGGGLATGNLTAIL